MAKHNAFVVPAGLIFEQVNGGLAIEHDGDIVLHGTMGQRLQRVRSNEGDVVLHMDAELEEISAPKGTITVHGNLVADSVIGHAIHVDGSLEAEGVYGTDVRIDGDVRAGKITAEGGSVRIGGSVTVAEELSSEGGDVLVAGDTVAPSVSAMSGRVVLTGHARADVITAGREVALHGHSEVNDIQSGRLVTLQGTVKARNVRAELIQIDADSIDIRMIQGRQRIAVGNGDIQADLFIAPQVDLSPQTTGRVTVIECHNPLGPNSVKGCLRLDDLETLIGDVDSFLEARGLSRLTDTRNPRTRAPTVPERSRAERNFAERAQERLERGATERQRETRPFPEHRPDPSLPDFAVRTSRPPEPARPSAEPAWPEPTRSAPPRAQPDWGATTRPPTPPPPTLSQPEPVDRPTEVTTAGRAPIANGAEDLFDVDTAALGMPIEAPAPEDVPDPSTVDEEFDMSAHASPPDAAPEPEPAPDTRRRRRTAGRTASRDDAASPKRRSTTRGERSSRGSSRSPRGSSRRSRTESTDAPEPSPEPTDASPAIEASEMTVEEVSVRPAGAPASGSARDRLMVDEPAPAPRSTPVQPIEEPEPEPESNGRAAAMQDPIYMLMLETVGRMTSCFDEAELPEPVSTLRGLVESRDYARIRSDFNGLWNDLLVYHQERGLQLQPKVSHTFRTIDTIVRNL